MLKHFTRLLPSSNDEIEEDKIKQLIKMYRLVRESNFRPCHTIYYNICNMYTGRFFKHAHPIRMLKLCIYSTSDFT